MDGKINVLDIDIDSCTAKEAMRRTMKYLESEPISIIEMVTADRLMQMDETPELKKDVRDFDLILAGDKAVLEAAEISDRRALQEVEGRIYLKMFLRYLHKNHKRLYLLVESEEEGQEFYNYFQNSYGGVQIIGLAKVSALNRADDMLVNAINGGETDCVIAALGAPLQEDFIVKNKSLLDTRIWLGIGKGTLAGRKSGNSQGRIAHFFEKYILKKELEKRKK